MGSDVREALKFRFLFDSNLFLIEFVGNMRSASPLIKPFSTLWGDTKRNARIGTFYCLAFEVCLQLCSTRNGVL